MNLCYDSKKELISKQYILFELPEHLFSLTPSSNSSLDLSTSISNTDRLPLPASFSLACLTSLKHLKLNLAIEMPFILQRPVPGNLSYSTPLEWMRRVLDELQAGARRDSSGTTSVTLEQLTLDVEFNLPNFQWSPITSALSSVLSSFSQAVPSLKTVELRIVGYTFGLIGHHGQKAGHLQWVVKRLKADADLAPLRAEGLLRISGWIMDSDSKREREIRVA